jgi:hypothetical protein
MADNPNQRGTQDRQRIDVSQEHELRYWTQQLGVSADKLREIVKRVGPMATDVRRALQA